MKAVITGDIINSTKIPAQVKEVLYRRLNDFFLAQTGVNPYTFKGETNQGDWFQVYLEQPSKALQNLLLIKTWLRTFPLEVKKNQSPKMSFEVDARMAIGIGRIDFMSNRLGSSDGPAFRISGRLLEKIKKGSTSIAGEVDNQHELNEELFALLTMLDFIMSKTTALQCQVIHRKLQGKIEVEIAEELGVLQSAINQRSTAAGWNVIETALKRFEKIVLDLPS